MYDSRPIGVFDSGIGGITVLKKLSEALPNENFIYFGDTARVPYGEKTPQQLLEFSFEILEWFKSLNAKCVLMACNTSSAVTLETVEKKYDFPVLGLIQPVAQHVAESNIDKIAVMATSATVKSSAYKININKLKADCEVIQTACPGLVELVEAGDTESDTAYSKVAEYVHPLLENNVNKIILGCTHYPYLGQLITRAAQNKVTLIDPAEYLTAQTVKTLKENKLANSETATGTIKCYASSSTKQFTTAARKFMPHCPQAELTNLKQPTALINS